MTWTKEEEEGQSNESHQDEGHERVGGCTPPQGRRAEVVPRPRHRSLQLTDGLQAPFSKLPKFSRLSRKATPIEQASDVAPIVFMTFCIL